MNMGQVTTSRTASSKNIIYRRNSSTVEYYRSFSFSQAAANNLETRKGGAVLFRYFTSESLFLLACLTASLLILPLVLPPLPPPPLTLLLIPILILGLLMVLAFVPTKSYVVGNKDVNARSKYE